MRISVNDTPTSPAEVINEQEAGQPRLFLRYKVTTGSLSDRTKLAYTYHINEFLAHYRITDLQPLKEYSPKVLKQMVKDYILHFRDDRKLSGSSISLHVAAIAHFFYIERDDDYKIDWKKVRLEIPPNENIRRDRAYTIEEIQKMLSVCSRTRERVVIHLLESTGMRVGAIPAIKIRDLSPKSTKQGGKFTGEVKCAKGFRKFYKTQSENSGMKPINVELTHGHSIGMSVHYYRPQESEVLNDYMTHAADALTIDPTKRLQQENHDLKTVQAEELENVKQGMENMKDWMKHCFKQIVEWTRPLNPELARDIEYNSFQLDEPEE